MGFMVCKMISFERFIFLGLFVDGREKFGYLVFVMTEDLCSSNIKVEGIVEGVSAHGRGKDWMGFKSLPTQTILGEIP